MGKENGEKMEMGKGRRLKEGQMGSKKETGGNGRGEREEDEQEMEREEQMRMKRKKGTKGNGKWK